jgi:predicted deacetylase
LKKYSSITLAERLVPDFVLAEFETFIMRVVPPRYQLSTEDTQKLKRVALRYMQSLTDECTVVTPDVQTVERARDIYFENATTSYISFVDCFVLAMAEKNTYTVFSKDKRMNTLAKQLHITGYEPPAI